MTQRIGLSCVVAVGLAALCTWIPVQAQNARGCNLPPQFACPEPRIISFEAKPATIKPGGSAELTWVTENTGTAMIAIAPTVGTVIARGAARVTPVATTTYTLSATGGGSASPLTKSVTVTVEGTMPVAAAETAMPASTETPRMADGKPKLQGVYSMFGGPGRGGAGRGDPGGGARGGGRGASGGGPPPAGGPGGAAEAQAALAPGQLPNRPTLKPGMEKYRTPAPDPNVVVSECGVSTVPVGIGPYNFQIIQNPDYVVILYEYMHLFRVISLDGTPHQPGPSSWMGDSVGQWEGDTLVIEHGQLQHQEHCRRRSGRRHRNAAALGQTAHGRADPAPQLRHDRVGGHAGRSRRVRQSVAHPEPLQLPPGVQAGRRGTCVSRT